MDKILFNCPLNISRSLLNMVKDFTEQEIGNNRFAFVNEQHRLEHKSSLLNGLEEKQLPILYIGMAFDFANMSDESIVNSFDLMPILELRSELREKAFANYNYWQVFAVVPFAIIYNKNLVTVIPTSWAEFASKDYYGKVRLPMPQLPVSRVTKAIVEDMFPDSLDDFVDNCIFSGSPIDVVNAVDNGECEFGIVNLSFSRVSRHKNTKILWLEDGLGCMPLIVAVRKGELAKVRKIIDYIFSEEVQEFLALQSFIPVLSKIKMPDIVRENQANIIWPGWKTFLSIYNSEAITKISGEKIL
ncbi:MAG: ABC transporter substrate-binding protein [Syntrophomonadaceae bacterium]|nr:ABC transporter substrate-binding protein [Syntrophomonadaceae bacterium]